MSQVVHERRAGRKALNYLEWTKRAKVMTDDPTLPFAALGIEKTGSCL
jgi:hypothetical protein